MTLGIETRERLPDWFRPEFDIDRMNQTVQTIERRFQNIEESLIQIDISNIGAGSIVGGDFAPLVHQHTEADITDLGNYVTVEYISDTMILGDINDVDLSGVQANYILKRNPTNDGWISALESGGGGFSPTLGLLADKDMLQYDVTQLRWENRGFSAVGYVQREGDVMEGNLDVPEPHSIRFGDTTHRILYDGSQFFMGSPRDITISGSILHFTAGLQGQTFTNIPTFDWIYTDGVDSFSTVIENNDAIFRHDTPAQQLRLQVRNAGDTAYEDGVVIDPDAGVALYFNDIPTARTQSNDFQVWDGAAWESVVLDTLTLDVIATANETTVDLAGPVDLSVDRAWTVGIADNPIMPGAVSMNVPAGTSAQEPTAADGMIRWDTDLNTLRFAEGVTPSWRSTAWDGGAFHDGFSDFVGDEHIAHSSIVLTVDGTASEIDVTGVDGDITASRTWTVGLSDNPILPGVASVTITTGTTAQEPAAVDGMIRWDSDLNTFRFTEGVAPTWRSAVWSGGAFHDGFSDYVIAEHIDWSVTGAENINIDRIDEILGLTNLSDATLTSPLTGALLYKSAGDWLDTDAVLIDPTAAVTIQFNTADAFRSASDSLEIREDGVAWLDIEHAGGGSTGIGPYAYSSTITTPPASGEIRFDNATISSATLMHVHYTNSDSVDVSNFLALFGDGAIFYVQESRDSRRWIAVEISSATDNTTYWTYGIQAIDVGSVAFRDGNAIDLIGSLAGTGGGGGALTDLTDVTITGAVTGDTLYKSAGDWVNTGQLQIITEGAKITGPASTQAWLDVSSITSSVYDPHIQLRNESTSFGAVLYIDSGQGYFDIRQQSTDHSVTSDLWIRATNNGSVQLYNNNNLRFMTWGGVTTGEAGVVINANNEDASVIFRDNSGPTSGTSTSRIGYTIADAEFRIEHRIAGEGIAAMAQNAGAADRILWRADPDTQFDAYHPASNAVHFSTNTDGAEIPTIGAFTIPVGTTIQEPTPANGMLRYDSTTGKLRGVEGGAWADIVGGGGGALNDLTDVTTAGVVTGDLLYKSAGDWIDTSVISLDPGTLTTMTDNLLLTKTEFAQLQFESTVGTGADVIMEHQDISNNSQFTIAFGTEDYFAMVESSGSVRLGPLTTTGQISFQRGTSKSSVMSQNQFTIDVDTVKIGDGGAIVGMQWLGGTNGSFAGTWLDGTSLFRMYYGSTTGGFQETAMEFTRDGDIALWHNNAEMARTMTAANGGWQINNALTGAGFERALTDNLADNGFRALLAANETYTSDITLGTITGFSTAVAASTRYKFRCVLYVTSGTAGLDPGLRLFMDHSGSDNVKQGRIREYRDSGLVSSVRALPNASTITGLVCGTATDENMIIYEGMIQTVTSGTLALQSAQNISNATSSIIQEGSTMEVWEE